MPIDPAGFAKYKYVITDGHGSVYPGIELLLTGAPTLADLDTLAAEILTNFSDNFVTQLHPDWTITGAQLLYSDGSTILEGTATAAVTGTFGGTKLPRSTCVVSHYQIEDYYRGGKPRTYWPFWVASQMASSTTWNGAAVGDLEGMIQDHLDAIAAFSSTAIPTCTPGCIRRVASGAPLVPPQFFPYVGSRVDSRLCTQRRRLGRLA